ncbi:MAG: AAA family ATPase [Candidatus Paracaedibacteraceae bacterium]|nr:AAA family ATPase [Candidatus Paracaedibacteraceae bacterium]
MRKTLHFPKVFLFLCLISLIMAIFIKNTIASQFKNTEDLESFENKNITQISSIKQKRKRTRIHDINSVDQPIVMPFEINDLHQYLNERIIGQNEAMLSLAISIHTHYLSAKINAKMIKLAKKNSSHKHYPLQKNNILLIGQEGCGKTECVGYIYDFLKQYSGDQDFNFPFVRCNNTSTNSEEFAKEIILNSLVLSKANIKKAEHALVFIDDIDQKLFSHNPGKGEDASHQIQKTWAPIIKGATITNEIPSSKDEKSDDIFKLNTHNMLFIAAGRFKTNTDANLQSYDDNDLEEYGFTSEFTDVFQSRVLFNQFNTKMLIQIIRNPDTPFINQTMTFLQEGYGITLEFSPEIFQELAKIAIKSNRCVQALQTTVNKLLENILKNAPKLRGQALIISKADIDALPRIKSKRERFEEKIPGFYS